MPLAGDFLEEISNFLEEISSLSHSVVFIYFFALITEEDFLISGQTHSGQIPRKINAQIFGLRIRKTKYSPYTIPMSFIPMCTCQNIGHAASP